METQPVDTPKLFYWQRSPKLNVFRSLVWVAVFTYARLFLSDQINGPFAVGLGLLLVMAPPAALIIEYGWKSATLQILFLAIHPLNLVAKSFNFILYAWIKVGTLKGFFVYAAYVVLLVTLAFLPALAIFKWILYPPLFLLLFITLFLPIKWCLSPLTLLSRMSGSLDNVGKSVTTFLEKKVEEIKGTSMFASAFITLVAPFERFPIFLTKLDLSTLVNGITVIVFLFVFGWTYIVSGILFMAVYKVAFEVSRATAFEVNSAFSGSNLDFFYLSFREMSGSSPYGVIAVSDAAKFVLLIQSNSFFYLQQIVFLLFTIIVIEVLRTSSTNLKSGIASQVEEAVLGVKAKANSVALNPGEAPDKG